LHEKLSTISIRELPQYDIDVYTDTMDRIFWIWNIGVILSPTDSTINNNKNNINLDMRKNQKKDED
jgi:hypothetical protein